MKLIKQITLSLLLLVTFSSPALANEGWSWDSLKKVAIEASEKAEQKVNEWVDLARSKWASWGRNEADTSESQSQAETQPRQTASDGAVVPEVTSALQPAVGETISITSQKSDRDSFKQLIEQSKKTIDGKAPIQVSSPGRAPQKDLPVSKSGVPRFSTVQVKSIPKIDIGVEKSISKNDLIAEQLIVGFKPLDKVKSLSTPAFLSKKELDQVRSIKVPLLPQWAGPNREKLGLGEIVTQEKVSRVNVEMNPLKPQENDKPIATVTSNDLKMLSALQINKKGDRCHIAAGLYYDLAKDSAHEEEANFNLGICSHKMGLHSEAIKRLLKVVKAENPEYTPDAIANLVEDLPREYDVQVAQAIKSVSNKTLIPDKAKDHMNYVLARAAYKKSNYQEAASAAEQVSAKSSLYPNARYLFAISTYALKKNRDAQKVLTDLKAWMNTNKKSDRNLETLITINLARMMFVEKRYQAAHEEYLKVPKDHPLWVPGLVEQGWTQLNIDDAAGAIGNMYSLHSPYFKSIFMPDSWIVRTIGYIDICQYGDAYRTLTKLEQLHNSHLVSLEKYVALFKKPEQYYNTVRNYIRGKSDQPVDGLPAPVIREIARQRGFLNTQDSLNIKEDEIVQYSFIQGLIAKDKQALQGRIAGIKERLNKINADLKKAEVDPALAKFINEWSANKRNEQSILKQYEYELTVYDAARSAYANLKSDALARLEKEKGQLRDEAGRELISHLQDLKKKLGQTLESNEFLRYEIFAGSGENIRYQVAGGATAAGQRVPSNVKPQKILNWEFDGEYWEDEIGSYRSTLRNNCPKNPRAHASVGSN